MADLTYEQMANACEQIGIRMLSEHTCLKLLAVVYVYGDESAVYSDTLRRDIRQACERFSLRGGQAPKLNAAAFRHYVRQIEAGDAPWLKSFGERYGVTLPPLKTETPPGDWRELLHGGLRISARQHGKTGQ